MIILLEGADLVGKSTVARLLQERTGLPSSSLWIDLQTPRPAVISVSKSLRLFLIATKIDIIFDRSFISELIYGRVFGRETNYIIPLIEEWSDVPACFLVILTATDAVLRRRYELRGDSLKLSDILYANALYHDLSRVTADHLRTITLPILDDSPGEVARRILTEIANVPVVGTAI